MGWLDSNWKLHSAMTCQAWTPITEASKMPERPNFYVHCPTRMTPGGGGGVGIGYFQKTYVDARTPTPFCGRN